MIIYRENRDDNESNDSVDDGCGGEDGGDDSSASSYGYRAMVITSVFDCLISDVYILIYYRDLNFVHILLF